MQAPNTTVPATPTASASVADELRKLAELRAEGLLSAPGDAGLDGLIRLDPLGLDVVYVQAKRYTYVLTFDLRLCVLGLSVVLVFLGTG
jgi:restriction endonuclease Mrr